LRHATTLAALLASALLATASAPARAEQTEASSRITLFDEPSSKNSGIRVLHPQVDATAPLGSAMRIAAGYSVDIVSGATPATFDTVTSATKFSDTRHLVRGGFGFERPEGGVTFGYAYGWESDYKSNVLSATTHHDLYEHNFTLALAYSHNWDDVCDNNNRAALGLPLERTALTSSAQCFTGADTVVTHRVHIDTLEPSLSWTMTPRLVVQGGATIQLLDGFQSNPYRKVLVGSQSRTPQEHHPDFRQRYAGFGRVAYALPELRASVLAMLRFYNDSWAVRALTGDLQATKYVGQSMLITGRAHYHVQSGASFYRNAQEYQIFGPPGQYWTGDRELSPMGNYLLGGKIAFFRRPQQERSSWFVEMELGAKYEVLLYQIASIYSPNSDRKFAHIVQGAFALRF